MRIFLAVHSAVPSVCCLLPLEDVASHSQDGPDHPEPQPGAADTPVQECSHWAAAAQFGVSRV